MNFKKLSDRILISQNLSDQQSSRVYQIIKNLNKVDFEVSEKFSKLLYRSQELLDIQEVRKISTTLGTPVDFSDKVAIQLYRKRNLKKEEAKRSNIIKNFQEYLSVGNGKDTLTDRILQDIENRVSQLLNIEKVRIFDSCMALKGVPKCVSEITGLLLNKIQTGYDKFNLGVFQVQQIRQEGQILYPQEIKQICNELYQARVTKDNSYFVTGCGQILGNIIFKGSRMKKQNGLNRGDLEFDNGKMYDVKNLDSKGSIVKAKDKNDKSYLNYDIDYIFVKNTKDSFKYKVIKKEEIYKYIKGFKKPSNGFNGGFILNWDKVTE